MPEISVVIPVYNAESCLNELYQRLCNSISSITEDFEIVLVEDCGKDNSWELIKELVRKDNRVRGLQFSRNFGQHYGITAGLDNCSGNWVVVMDCDLQDPPEAIPELYRKAQDGFDIVLARRANRKDNKIKVMFSKMFYRVFRYLSDTDYDGEVGNFRIMSQLVVKNYCRLKEQLRFFPVMISWFGFKQTTLDIEHSKRHSGKSSYTFKKYLKLATDIIICNTDKPLKISIQLGFIISFFSVLYGIYIFTYAFLHHTYILGWSSLIVSLYFLGGIIIAILGIIGIYLGKTFDEAKRRPLYVIREKTFED